MLECYIWVGALLSKDSINITSTPEVNILLKELFQDPIKRLEVLLVKDCLEAMNWAMMETSMMKKDLLGLSDSLLLYMETSDTNIQ